MARVRPLSIHQRACTDLAGLGSSTLPSVKSDDEHQPTDVKVKRKCDGAVASFPLSTEDMGDPTTVRAHFKDYKKFVKILGRQVKRFDRTLAAQERVTHVEGQIEKLRSDFDEAEEEVVASFRDLEQDPLGDSVDEGEGDADVSG